MKKYPCLIPITSYDELSYMIKKQIMTEWIYQLAFYCQKATALLVPLSPTATEFRICVHLAIIYL